MTPSQAAIAVICSRWLHPSMSGPAEETSWLCTVPACSA